MNMTQFTSTLSLALALGLLGSVPASLAETVTTTEKTTTYSGVVSEVNPTTSTIILKSEKAPAPVTYNFTKETTFVDGQGKVVSYETIQNLPVTVEYLKDGDRTIVRRVVVTKTGSTTKEETTTSTPRRIRDWTAHPSARSTRPEGGAMRCPPARPPLRTALAGPWRY